MYLKAANGLYQTQIQYRFGLPVANKFRKSIVKNDWQKKKNENKIINSFGHGGGLWSSCIAAVYWWFIGWLPVDRDVMIQMIVL